MAILMFMLVTVPVIIGMVLRKFSNVPNFEPIAKKNIYRAILFLFY